MPISGRLKEERVRLGLTQTEFAVRAGITRNTQSRYEGGQTKPTTEYLERIRELGVDADYVFFGGPKSESGKFVSVREGVDGVLLASVIEAFELALGAAGKKASAKRKARAVVMAYRSSKEAGKVDPKAIEDIALLAADD